MKLFQSFSLDIHCFFFFIQVQSSLKNTKSSTVWQAYDSIGAPIRWFTGELSAEILAYCSVLSNFFIRIWGNCTSRGQMRKRQLLRADEQDLKVTPFRDTEKRSDAGPEGYIRGVTQDCMSFHFCPTLFHGTKCHHHSWKLQLWSCSTIINHSVYQFLYRQPLLFFFS